MGSTRQLRTGPAVDAKKREPVPIAQWADENISDPLERKVFMWNRLRGKAAASALDRDTELAIEIARRVLGEGRLAHMLRRVISAELFYRDLVYAIPPTRFSDGRTLVPRNALRPALMAKLVGGLNIVASPSLWGDLAAMHDEACNPAEAFNPERGIVSFKGEALRHAFREQNGKNQGDAYREKHLRQVRGSARKFGLAFLSGRPGRPKGATDGENPHVWTIRRDEEIARRMNRDHSTCRRGYVRPVLSHLAKTYNVTVDKIRKLIEIDRKKAKRTTA